MLDVACELGSLVGSRPIVMHPSNQSQIVRRQAATMLQTHDNRKRPKNTSDAPRGDRLRIAKQSLQATIHLVFEQLSGSATEYLFAKFQQDAPIHRGARQCSSNRDL